MSTAQVVHSRPVIQEAQFAPARVIEIELSRPLPDIEAFDKASERWYTRAFCLFRLHTRPLGLVEIPLSEKGASPQEYAPRAWQQLREQIIQHLQEDNLPLPAKLDADGLVTVSIPHCLEEREQFLAQAPFVSVIVPTHNRPEYIGRCLAALVRQQYPTYEILVVDNAPSTAATAALVQKICERDSRVRYIHLDQAGSSRARNQGMKEAKGQILAFIDDDIVADTCWLTELVRAFSLADKVVCTLGSVVSLHLDTPAELWAEGNFKALENGEKMKKLFTPRILKSSMRPELLTSFSIGGSGNMATTAAFLRHIGGFDPALGPGTPTRGAEDFEVFVQASMHGCTLVYEPAALVYHSYRADDANLRRQMYGFAVCGTAVLTKILSRYPQLFIDYLLKVPRVLASAQKEQAPDAKNNVIVPAGEDIRKKAPAPMHEEVPFPLLLKGLFYGPFAYMKSFIVQGNRREVRSNRKSATPLWLATPPFVKEAKRR